MPQDPLYAVFEAAYADHHSQFARARDPLALVHRYEHPADQEIVGFLCSLLAYGNVATILSSCRKILGGLGTSPYQSLSQSGRFRFPEFRHRFTTGEDIEVVLYWIHQALRSHGSLENFFVNRQPPGSPIRELLSGFTQRFTSQPLPKALQAQRERRKAQLKYLLSDPSRGSACKRLNMYLRWMVRPADGIDLGLWKSLSPASLILPLDTHVLQTIRALRWTRSPQASWKVAEQATARLKKLCPEDPIRYDFSLCHLSMAGGKILHYKARYHAAMER